MATTRTKDVGVTKTTLAADTYLYGDGNTDGSHKILGSDVANYVASEEGGSTLASLSGGKVPASQLPSGFDAGTYLGLWDANANSPALSNGSGTQGDYYIVGTAGTTSIDGESSWAVGDEIRANASAWEKLTPGTTAVTQGGTGATTAEGARTNLEVDSKDEAAEGLTRNEPSLYFNGTNEYVSVADNAAFSMTDGTDDLPAFWSFWVKVDDWTSQFLVSKYGGSAATREWAIDSSGSDNLVFFLTDTSGNSCTTTLSGMNAYEGQWVHVCITYAGAGPNSSNAFSAAQNGVNIYINGADQTGASHNNNASYTGQSDTSQAVHIGRENTSYGEFEIRELQIGNSALTAAQVEQVYRSGVPFELSQASAAAAYTSDFTGDSVDSYSQNVNVTLDATLTVGSDSDNVAFSPTTDSSLHSYQRTVTTVPGKKYRYEIEYYCPSGQGIDGFRQYQRGGNDAIDTSVVTATTDAWTKYTVEFVATTDSNTLVTYLADSGGTTFTGVTSDKFYIRNVVVKEIGAILDLNAADATISGSNINLPDRSGNGFNGTSSNMTIAANAVNLPAALSANHPNPSSGEALLTLGNGGSGADFAITEDWSQAFTPGVTFGGNSTGMTFSLQEGRATKVGNLVFASFALTLTAKGSSTGNAYITGLPFSAETLTASTYGASVARFANGAGLDSPVSGLVDNSGTEIQLFDHSATGAASIDHSNFTDTTIIRGSIIYRTN